MERCELIHHLLHQHVAPIAGAAYAIHEHADEFARWVQLSRALLTDDDANATHRERVHEVGVIHVIISRIDDLQNECIVFVLGIHAHGKRFEEHTVQQHVTRTVLQRDAAQEMAQRFQAR